MQSTPSFTPRAIFRLETVLLASAVSAFGATPSGDRTVVENMPGLVAFWTFGEPPGQPRVSSATKERHPLQEVGGPIARVAGGPFSGYAATRREVPEATWCTLGFTYDGAYIRACIDGVLDARELDPVKDRRNDRYFMHEGPGGKDRGMNPYYHGRGIFSYDPVKHAKTKIGGSDFTVGARMAVGSMLREATKGRFGGLAVFNRALSDAEMRRLHRAAAVDVLNR